MIPNNRVRELLEQSLALANAALEKGNYPIGAIFTDQAGIILGSAQNECTSSHDVTAHAEIVGIRALGTKAEKDNPEKIILFTSLEPCFGCSFFIARTNITKIYSALKDPHKGGLDTLKQQEQFRNFFKTIDIQNDIFEDLRDQSKNIMMQYFLRLGRKDAARFYGYQD